MFQLAALSWGFQSTGMGVFARLGWGPAWTMIDATARQPGRRSSRSLLILCSNAVDPRGIRDLLNPVPEPGHFLLLVAPGQAHKLRKVLVPSRSESHTARRLAATGPAQMDSELSQAQARLPQRKMARRDSFKIADSPFRTVHYEPNERCPRPSRSVR